MIRSALAVATALALFATPTIGCEYMKQQRDATASLSEPAQSKPVQSSPAQSVAAPAAAQPSNDKPEETQTAQSQTTEPAQPKSN